MLDLAGLPPLDHKRTGEPPLEGRSLAPLVMTDNVVKAGADFGFNVSYSQYGRARCPTDLFVPRCAENNPVTSSAAMHYMGYSVRTYTHRYTRWVNVTVDGSPTWSNAIGEELYEEHTLDGSDDYDQSELVNLIAHPLGDTPMLLAR